MSLIEQTYMQAGLDAIPRVLSHMDRNPLSPTHGLFDRALWAWKTAPFADASHSYALRLLAQACTLNHPDNNFYQNEQLLMYIHAGLEAWTKLQHGDGSFDQVFPNDRSFGATAYTLTGILDVLAMMEDKLSPHILTSIDSTIRRAGEFLLHNDEGYGSIANHIALFAVCFEQLYLYTNDARYKQRATRTVTDLLGLFSPEGWFSEYDGADPGYQTQCIHYATRLMDMGHESLRMVTKTAVRDFMPYFIHPDGSLGGHYGARLTGIAYPGGLASMAHHVPEASAMLALLAEGVRRKTTPVPADLDLPNALRLASNYLDAAQILRKNERVPTSTYMLPCLQKNIRKPFPQAGLLAIGTPAYYAVAGLKTGGTLVAFDKKTGLRTHENHGYAGTIDGSPHTTHVPGLSKWSIKDNTATTTAPFSKIGLMSMTPLRHILLLLAGLTLFRSKTIREWAKKGLVARLIKPQRPSRVTLKRIIHFTDTSITFNDTIHSHDKIHNLTRLDQGSAIHMASADYFDFSILPTTNQEPGITEGFSNITTWDFLSSAADGKENSK